MDEGANKMKLFVKQWSDSVHSMGRDSGHLPDVHKTESANVR